MKRSFSAMDPSMGKSVPDGQQARREFDITQSPFAQVSQLSSSTSDNRPDFIDDALPFDIRAGVRHLMRAIPVATLEEARDAFIHAKENVERAYMDLNMKHETGISKQADQVTALQNNQAISDKDKSDTLSLQRTCNKATILQCYTAVLVAKRDPNSPEECLRLLFNVGG